ncbi:MAG: flavodoxin-dependent (E)-4-hydroxy-3-methylbut-2-enyl-diphosphate synthase, partial [Oscillospiraceae bacterium]|nr:flavodoxin-dependent (E)-4-hydroxy-3-methylbut-2-enyl-diphosphate synthase [Oscillospiraceae bacterium]
LGLRGGYELISCPTCGRCGIDLIPMAEEVERRLAQLEAELSDSSLRISVAVMGCVVNGPGEASAADYGIAGGKDEGVIFKRGQIVKKVPANKLVDELFSIIMINQERNI